MVANGGKSPTFAQAMREAGYSENYARNPQKLKATKTWQELSQESMPDEEILKRHRELLSACKVETLEIPIEAYNHYTVSIHEEIGWKLIGQTVKGKTVRLMFAVPDNKAILSALDMAYKLKGAYQN